MSNDLQWRFLLGFGAVPAAMVVVCSLLEERWYPAPVKDKTQSSSSTSGRNTQKIIREMIQTRQTRLDLLVTGGGWFIYDVAYYGVSLFGGQIVAAVYPTDDDNVSSPESLRQLTGMQLLALSMSVPAILLSIYMLKFMTVKQLQVVGFSFIVVCFLLLGGLFTTLRGAYSDALYAIYCVLLFSLSFGPNLSTFILPAQTYPKEVRATFNGVSAACGKLGAFVGVYMFGPMAEVTSYSAVMIACGIISAAGALITQFCLYPPIETVSKDSKDNDNIGFRKEIAAQEPLLAFNDDSSSADVEHPVSFHRGSFG
jgi:PHS family inorganic phosphate transporter-like MFS transporter